MLAYRLCNAQRIQKPLVISLRGLACYRDFPKPALGSVEGAKVEEEAEACFRKAIDIARQQQAKSWELRAATSLARLWQEQGKIEEARELLAPVYNWFAEGFETADF